MIGNNQLILNEASMIQAVQEYLTKRITVETPYVEAVRFENGEFQIQLCENKIPK